MTKGTAARRALVAQQDPRGARSPPDHRGGHLAPRTRRPRQLRLRGRGRRRLRVWQLLPHEAPRAFFPAASPPTISGSPSAARSRERPLATCEAATSPRGDHLRLHRATRDRHRRAPRPQAGTATRAQVVLPAHDGRGASWRTAHGASRIRTRGPRRPTRERASR